MGDNGLKKNDMIFDMREHLWRATADFKYDICNSEGIQDVDRVITIAIGQPADVLTQNVGS